MASQVLSVSWQYCGVTPRLKNPSTRPPVRRVGPALCVGLAVLCLHAALLGLLPQTAGVPHSVAPRPLQVRQLALPTGLATAAANAEAAPALAAASPAPRLLPGRALGAPGAPSTPRASRAPHTAETPAPSPSPPPAVATSADTAELLATAADPSADTEPAQAAANDSDGLAVPGEAAPTSWPAGTPVPTYATRLPPPATLQYTVQRDGPGANAALRPAREGLQAQLTWRPDVAAASYSLALGLGSVGSASVGGLDLHGIAPERHVETRRGREVRAANFQRPSGPGGAGAGRITFSGPRIEHPLLPGVQDRLSWLLQLAGVLAAEPALGQPGRELTLLVVGVRGDAAVWTFRVRAVQALQLPAGEVLAAVHLQREARHPYDTRVDVWLDPARHHLPVRWRLQHRAEGPGTAFELLRLAP